MRNTILRIGVMMIFLLTIFNCSHKQEEKSIDIDLIKAEIQAIEDNFALIYNNRNADSLTYYADDAISYFAGQEPIMGKEAIHKHIQEELMDFEEGAEISFKTLEIYVTDDGSHVAEIGEHKLVDSTGTVLQKGHYMSFFAKRDGKYVCVRDMANSFQIGSEEQFGVATD